MMRYGLVVAHARSIVRLDHVLIGLSISVAWQ